MSINNVSARYFLIMHERARVYALSLTHPTSNCEWYLLLRLYTSQMQDLMFIIYGATTRIYYHSAGKHDRGPLFLHYFHLDSSEVV